MAPLRFLQFRAECQEPMLTLHRRAMNGFTHGMSQQEEEADLRSIEQAYLRDGGEFLVGLLGDRLVAMGGFRRLTTTTAELKRMRVETELQDQGYGSQLLRELERLAFQRGFRTLCLETARERRLTLAFYSKHGYQEAGQGFYGAVETVRFTKRLDEESYQSVGNKPTL